MADYQATIYPGTTANPTVANADTDRKPVAVCFSGGGSRALTCAWGQLLGLTHLKDADGKPLLDDVRYISSVSGGSWAAVLYTFRPETVTDAEFLGNRYSPSQLFYGQDTVNGLNVCNMGDFALGKVPQNFANLLDLDPLQNIIADFISLTALKRISLADSAKWLWMYIIGKNVLADFGLYSYKNSIVKHHETPWNYADAKFFSLSQTYAENVIFSKTGAPPKDAFIYTRTDAKGRPACPMLIINTNISGKVSPGVSMAAPIQIPTQVSAVAVGVYGNNPYTADNIGGGSVESFAFTSKLAAPHYGTEQVTAEVSKPYTLADITACSSVFYAFALVDPIQTVVAKLLAHSDEHLHSHFANFAEHAEQLALDEIRDHLSTLNNDLQTLSKESMIERLVPQYNYWPVSQTALGPAANQDTEFTDGGNLENTGIAGLLAQVQGTVSHIIAFVNGAEVLEHKDGQIIAATQMAALFGVAYDGYERFENYLPNGVNPFIKQADPFGFLQIFDNSHGEFDALRQGLYATNGAGAESDAAFCRQTLTVLENQLLGITQTYPVEVLWVQNAQVNHWQDQITDATLKEKIAIGQRRGGDSEFANFPYYDTFKKIHQTAAETNTLAQMWAWCVSDQESPLSTAIAEMFL